MNQLAEPYRTKATDPDPTDRELLYCVRRFEDSLEEALGRCPTDLELAIETGLPISRVAELRQVVLDPMTVLRWQTS